MWAYIVRRVLYSVPILICVNLITFFLFFYVNTPDDVAHTVLGRKYGSPSNVYSWKREHQYHLPMFLNLKDRILYANGEGTIPDDIKQVFKGYKIDSCRLNRETLLGKHAADENDDKNKEEEYLETFRKRVSSIKKNMGGNDVVMVDWADMQDDEARIFRSVLEKGVPFICLLRGDATIPDPLNLPVVAPVSVPKDSGESEQFEELRRTIDARQARGMEIFSNTVFFKKSVRLFWFQFGKSDRGDHDISREVVTRMGPSLMITVPAFVLGLGLNIFIAMIVAYCRGTYVDRMMAIVCIIIMSVLSLFYYFSVQLVFGVWLKVFPVSGFLPGLSAWRFVLLPIAVSVFIGIGRGVRFYRTIFLEETNKEYVRTARAKGMTQFVVLFKHVLKNAMIPILTNVVLVIPMLFMGSLILESFFAIPGLGRFTLEGIQAQDFRIVGSMVYLGSFLYIVGLILTDISYTLVDPRVRLE